MKNPVIKSIFRSHKTFLSSFSSVFSLGILGLSQLASAVPAEVFMNQLVQEYDGNPKFPNFSTDPPGLSLEVTIFPRSQSEVVFQTIPIIPEPSYASFGIEGLAKIGQADKALGEEIDLGGSNRFLESIAVTLVNSAQAADWPTLAAENPAGYPHPLTLIVYRVEGNSLTLLAQKTQQTLIPWRPATLDDGSEYPFGGIGMNVRFDINETVALSGRIAVLVAYNTESGGFAPIGQAGPYNSLNLALANKTPLVGADVDETKMLRILVGNSPSRSGIFEAQSPLFTVRAFPATPAPGTPLEAGRYRVSATVSTPGFEGESVDTLQLTPLEAAVSLSNLRQVATGTSKSVTVTTDPLSLSANVVFARRSSPPVAPGVYPVFVSLAPGNYAGAFSGTLRLGYTYASWIAEKVADGSVLPALAERSHDPDLDGRSNFREYLLATNPGLADAGSPSLLHLTKATNLVKLGFLRNNEAFDVTYQLQETTDLSDPSAWSNLVDPPESMDPFQMTEQIVVDSPLSPLSPSKFFRLKIITPDP
jgi:hypothetical protein